MRSFSVYLPDYLPLRPSDMPSLAQLEAEVYLPGDRIIGEGEIGEELFFIKTGAVQVSFKGIPITVLGAGSYFGEIAVLKASADSPGQLQEVAARGEGQP